MKLFTHTPCGQPSYKIRKKEPAEYCYIDRREFFYIEERVNV